jgi:hypothetical protein
MKTMMRPRLKRRWAWVAVVLMLNLALWDLCAAAGESDENLDSVDERLPDQAPPPAPPGPSPANPASDAPKLPPPVGDGSTIRLIDPDLVGDGSARGDADAAGADRAPVYKRWWFWTIVGGAVATAVVMAAGGGDEARPNLPGFPPPPER